MSMLTHGHSGPRGQVYCTYSALAVSLRLPRSQAPGGIPRATTRVRRVSALFALGVPPLAGELIAWWPVSPSGTS